MMRSQSIGPVFIVLLFFGIANVSRASETSPLEKRIVAAGEDPSLPEITSADDWIRGVSSGLYAPISATHEPSRSFRVETRAEKMKHAPCELCHVEAMTGEKRAIAADPAASSHGAVDVVHAPLERMVCATCHDYQHGMRPYAGSGTALDFDRTYELCAGCHGTQYADWRGGAHGKRLGNWGGTRIVRSCTGCHDPHRPAFPARAPATYAAPPSSWEFLRQ